MVLGAPLSREIEPQRRADLAITPANAASHLRSALGGRLVVARIPGMLALGMLGLALFVWLKERAAGRGGGGHYDGLETMFAGMLMMGAFCGLIADCMSLASLWSTARAACLKRGGLSLTKALLAGTGRVVGLVLLMLAILAALSQFADPMASLALTGTAITALAWFRERRAWKQLAESYLVMDP